MFEAKIKEPKLLVDAVKAAYELVKDEVTFKIGKGGLVLRAMDPANVAMVIMELDAKAFEEYNLEEESFIGVNMERFMQVLKRVKRSDTIEISVANGKMELVYRGKYRRRFTIPLLALESGPRPEPELKFSVKAVVRSKLLKEAVEDATVVSDAMTLVGANDELHLLAQGDLGDVETIIKKGQGLKEIDVQDSSRAKYSTEYLKKITKTRIGDEVGVAFKSDYPLMVQFSEPELKLAFILAPRMDVE
jgi:proliferating cell nuclear antigen